MLMLLLKFHEYFLNTVFTEMVFLNIFKKLEGIFEILLKV